MCNRWPSLILAVALGVGASDSFAQNLLPPLAQASPRLRFHLGQTANNLPVISPILPNMPYDPSAYFVSQWNQSSYIQPMLMTRFNRATFDNQWGLAQYSFESADGHAHVWVYADGATWVYELYETGGSLGGAGGSNIFLGSDQMVSGTFDTPITLDFDAKLSKATVYGSADVQASGVVLAQVFSGFGYLFTDPATNNQQFVFMQIPIAVSGGNPVGRTAKFFCTGTNKVSLFQPNLANNELTLPYVSDAGPLHHFHYLLNGYLNDLLTTSSCGQTWSSAASNPKNWSLTSFYIGLETETEQVGLSPQGYLEAGLQIANLTLIKN